MIRRFISFLFVVFVAVSVMLAAIGFAGYMGKVTRYVQPEIDMNLMAADAVVVLTGGRDRVKFGADLLAAGKGEKLLVTGAHPMVKASSLFDVAVIPHDVQECCVVLGHVAGDTYGNARETLAFMGENGYRSIILVTSNYHMPRSLLVFQSIMPDTKIIPYPVLSPAQDLTGWWGRPAMLFLLVQEYAKYVAVWLST